MPTLLVTGGCGFIGSNFVRHLLHADPTVSVVNFDALTYAGNLANLADVEKHPRYKFVRGDITDRDSVRKAMSHGVTDVINFAAESHVDRSIQDSGPFVRTNVIGTQILLDAAREFNVSKYVQVSTDEVYGSLGPTGAFTETTPLDPSSPYSASKAAADLLVQAYQHTFGLPAVVTRCSNNYGPYQFPEKLIPLFVTNLLRDEPVPVYGDGMQVRDWIHVLDHCTGVEAAWRKGKPGEVYNFGGRCEKPNLELTHLVLDLLGKPKTLIRYVQDRPGHDRRYAIDCTKAERELGWSPRVPFEQGLRETIEWYQANADWIAGIRNKDYLGYYEKQYGRSPEPESHMTIRGVILAGGKGTRLGELTKVTNKHLLPVGPYPMVINPLKKLVGAGLTDVMLVSGTEHMGDFVELLGSGKEYGCRLTYRVQDEAGGIAQALSLAELFCTGSRACVLLGDNIYLDPLKTLLDQANAKPDWAWLGLKRVPDPGRYGVAELKGDKVVGIEEKPKAPKSDTAVVGIYVYPADVFEVIKTLKPSARGEYEITDVNNHYLRQGRVGYTILDGYWTDAGTLDSLDYANELVRKEPPRF